MSTNLATCCPPGALHEPSTHDARLQSTLRSVIDGGPAAISERLEKLDRHISSLRHYFGLYLHIFVDTMF